MLISIGVSIESKASNKTLLLARDGSFYDVKVLRISQYQVVFINNRRKAQGKIKIPTKLVYAIMDMDGSNVFFDEDGKQFFSPASDDQLKGTILFTKNSQFFSVYDLRINNEGLFYRVKDDKHAQYYKMEHDKVFMVKHEDKHVTLFTNKYGRAWNAVYLPQEPPYEHVARTDVSASIFEPATGMDPHLLYDSVCRINPYTLYKPGIMLEYDLQKEGYLDNIHHVTFIRQQVSDLRSKDGLLIPFVMQMIYDDEHERVRGVPVDYYKYMFPVEIDGKGNFHLTNNLILDLMQIDSRKGFGCLIPGELKAGQRLPCGTLTSIGKSFDGKKITVESTFKEWHVVGETVMSTGAGTFDCMKLRGLIHERKNGKNAVTWKIACYLAKGIGIVCYDMLPLDGKQTEPLTLSLRRMQDNTK